MFLKNKDVIDQYLQDNDGTTLSINDVNFMSCFKLKKMTRAIDKEERQLEKEIKREQINSQRARDLGIDSNKILIKRQNKK